MSKPDIIKDVLTSLRTLISPTNPLRLAWHFFWNLGAAIRYRFPSHELILIGVTGTNGKTTTSALIANILNVAGYRTAIATTEFFRIGEREWKNTVKLTTTGRGGIQKFLREAVSAGCTHAVIEVSSHALTQYRTLGLEFDAAALTNITTDHLDYHETFANYLEAKQLLFWQLAKSDKKSEKIAVLPFEDPSYAKMSALPFENQLSYGITHGDLHTTNLRTTKTGQACTIVGWQQAFTLTTPLIGLFNIANILAATGIALGLGIGIPSIQKAVAGFHGVAGRMEEIRAGQQFRVVVDFAHTPDALEKILQAVRPITAGNIILICGAAGDRPRAFRHEMGAIAAKYADTIILTTDDPYDADPEQILADMASGAEPTTQRHPGVGRDPKNKQKHKNTNSKYQIIIDRKLAIAQAIKLAKKGDTVIIAGKGAQPYQYLAHGHKIPWDDREVARKALAH